MRYLIDFNKTINQLVPYYMGGRKLILFLQAMIKPLDAINKAFSEYAKEKRIETCMTSQKLKFEWYLNRQLGQYFLEPEARISIDNGAPIVDEGTALYYQADDYNPENTENPLYYNHYDSKETAPSAQSDKTGYIDEEGVWQNDTPRADRQDMVLKYSKEAVGEIRYSFVVNAPIPDQAKISQTDYNSLLTSYIEKYRLANKTYIINYF